MKLIKPISTIHVKRAFAVSQFARMRKHYNRSRALVLRKEFIKSLVRAKKKALGMSVKQLNKLISDGYEKRLTSYNASKWYIAEVKINEVGVWKRAGELPLSWTNKSLRETARMVSHAIDHKLKYRKVRAARVIPSMLRTNIDILKEDNYLFPIVFKHGTGTNGRESLKFKVEGDIDDGCMRSIALAVNGNKTIKVYFGVPIKKHGRLN
jgi:hypothetical protein